MISEKMHYCNEQCSFSFREGVGREGEGEGEGKREGGQGTRRRRRWRRGRRQPRGTRKGRRGPENKDEREEAEGEQGGGVCSSRALDTLLHPIGEQSLNFSQIFRSN
jgi:hypothetical protein